MINVRPSKQKVMQHSIARDFTGGWNVVDNQKNLKSVYAPVLTNMMRRNDGTLGVRYGTELFKDLTSTLGSARIVELVYFQQYIIVFASDGKIYSVTGSGTVATIWDSTIAGALGVAAWSAHQFVSTAVYGSTMIVCNGIDKPLDIDMTRSPNKVIYLGDPASGGANTFVPIGKYVETTDRYAIISGNATYPSRVYISSQDGPGVWKIESGAAPAPNSAVYRDLTKSSPTGANNITGLKRYKNNVLVLFDNLTLVGVLGILDGSGNHQPDFTQYVEAHGSVAARTVSSTGDDVLMMDYVGIPSLKQGIISSVLRPERLSELIAPHLQTSISAISQLELERRAFAVYNRIDGQYMLFVPNNDSLGSTTETVCYTYTRQENVGVRQWALFKGWNFVAGCTSALDRVFLATQKKIYQLGASVDEYFADFINDNETAIAFDWETPWIDFNTFHLIKHVQYLHAEIEGSGTATIEAFTDDLYVQAGSYTPDASINVIGIRGSGYGVPSAQPYGGGAVFSDFRLYYFPVVGSIFKFRMHGSTKTDIRLVSLSLLYQVGSIYK